MIGIHELGIILGVLCVLGIAALLVVAAIYYSAVWRRGTKATRTPDQERDRRLNILKERYAQGEITKEEYDTMRKDLE